MAAIAWKKNFKPEKVIAFIQKNMIVEENTVRMPSFDSEDALTTLQTMVDFKNRVNVHEREELLSKAIRACAIAGKLDSNSLIEALNLLLNHSLATREEKFYLLTSASIAAPFFRSRIQIDGCTVTFLKGDYPRRYSSRSLAAKNWKSGFEKNTPKNYCRIIISCKAKSPTQAAEKCFDSFDILRAFLCFFTTPALELTFGGPPAKSLNKVILGGFHTVHSAKGKFTDHTWGQPDYIPSPAHKLSPQAWKNCEKAMKELDKCSYKSHIKNSLLRYVRAFDEIDRNTALLKIWGALESLAAPGEPNADSIPRRCSALFYDSDYHEQVLQHLREYRNTYTHKGLELQNVSTHCYQAQRYFIELVLFHLRNSKFYSNLDQANSFLDLPTSLELLNDRIRITRRAVRLRSPK